MVFKFSAPSLGDLMSTTGLGVGSRTIGLGDGLWLVSVTAGNGFGFGTR
jgi:hypothetical protein